MIYILLASVIVLAILALVQAMLLIQIVEKLEWVRLTLIPWINALNTKLGLPK